MNRRSVLEFSPGAAGPLLSEKELPWHMRATCRDAADPEIFFATQDRAPAKVAQAKAVCSACPVRAECLADGIAVDDRYGIRGGTTWAERRPEAPQPRRYCRSGRHLKTEANTYASNGKCRPCALAKAAANRAEERVIRTGSSSPQSGRRAA